MVLNGEVKCLLDGHGMNMPPSLTRTNRARNASQTPELRRSVLQAWDRFVGTD
jgi:hypothetical protein